MKTTSITLSETLTIYRTKDYDRFDLLKANRPIRPAHVKDIKQSILTHGNLMHLYPIIVKVGQGRPGRERLIIYEGQHRFMAAREINEVVYYVPDLDGRLSLRTLQATNTAQQKWSYRDYLHSYCEQGHSEYLSLRDFLDEFPVPIMSAIQMLHSWGDNRRQRLDFKVGLFKMHNEGFVRYVCEASRALSRYIAVAWHADFLAAISMLCRNPDFDLERLLHKAEYNQAELEKRGGVMEFFEQLLRIYNWKCQESNIVVLQPIDASGRVCVLGRWVSDEKAIELKTRAEAQIRRDMEAGK